jgi:hypothetical protein
MIGGWASSDSRVTVVAGLNKKAEHYCKPRRRWRPAVCTRGLGLFTLYYDEHVRPYAASASLAAVPAQLPQRGAEATVVGGVEPDFL